MAKHNPDQILGADARLVALLAELTRQDTVIEAIAAEKLPPGQTPTSEDQAHRLDLAADVRDAIIKEITATPARSAAELHAKAQALMMILDSEIMSSDEASNDQLAFALADDVLANAPTMRPHAVREADDEVAVLGIRLAAAITYEEDLANRETAEKNASAQIYLKSAWLDAVDEANGLRDMIPATPATSLAGAAVQIVEAIARFDLISGTDDPLPIDERAISRLLFSVLDVVADAAGSTDPKLVELLDRNSHLNPWVPVERRWAAVAEALG